MYVYELWRVAQDLQHPFFTGTSFLVDNVMGSTPPYLFFFNVLASSVNALITSTPYFALVQKQSSVSRSFLSCQISSSLGLSSLSRSHLFPISITWQYSSLFSLISSFQLSLMSLNVDSLLRSKRMTMESAPLQQAEMMDRKVSWPAVSHIWSLTFLLSTSMVRNRKSTPMVARRSPLNWSSTKRMRREDLPTPELPTRTTLNYQSQLFFINNIIEWEQGTILLQSFQNFL